MSTDGNMDAKHATKLLLMDAYRHNTKQDMNLALWRFYMNLIMGVSFVARTPLWHIDIASYAVMHGYSRGVTSMRQRRPLPPRFFCPYAEAC